MYTSFLPTIFGMSNKLYINNAVKLHMHNQAKYASCIADLMVSFSSQASEA